MRKIFSTLVAVCCVLSMANFAEALTLRLAGQNPLEHQNSIQMENLKKIIAEKTDGRIEIKTYPAGQLGDYVLVYEEVSRGTIDMALITVPPQFDARQQLYWVPYLVSSWSELDALFDPNGWLYKQIGSFHEKMDIKFLGFFMDGLGGLGLTKEATEPLKPGVAKNILCRIPNNEIAQLTLTTLGYSTVSVPYADLYTALQTGVAEGWYGGSAVHSYLGFRDVLKHYYAFNLYPEIEQWVINQRVWDDLSDEDKQLLESTIAEINKNSIKIAEQEEMKYQKALAEAGVKVHVYSSEELKPSVEFIRENVWPKLGSILGEDLVQAMIQQYSHQD